MRASLSQLDSDPFLKTGRALWTWLLLAALAAAQPLPWQKLESREGKFSVEMPGVARSSLVPVQTSAGMLKQFQFLVDQGERAFLVTYLDYPNTTLEQLGPARILDNVREGVRASGAQDLTEKSLEIPRADARELTYLKTPNFYLQSRLLLVGNRFYQLTLVTTGAPSPDATRFFESFRFQP